MNNTTNNIKITVEYEQPKQAKFNELLIKYHEIEQASKETISYYKPLADAAEHKKIELILKQIETIKDYILKLNNIKPSITEIKVELEIGAYKLYRVFSIKYQNYDNTFIIKWCGMPFNVATYKLHPRNFTEDTYNILGNWDNWRMYEQLEQKCFDKLNKLINQEKQKAENEINRLKNITE